MSWDTTTTASSNVLYFEDAGTSANTITITGMMSNMTSSMVGWCGTSAGLASYNGVYGYGGQRGWSPEQVRELELDFAAVKKDRARKRAEIKARKLFKRAVGDVAYHKFVKLGYHEIYGASRTRYQLRPGRWVRVMGEGAEVKHELCAHLPMGVPWFDTMAVQHLMLTASKETEEQFIKIANKHTAGIYPIEAMRDVG